MYFDTPNKKWDLSLYQEIFQVLIKYNDRIGVETFWEMMKEMQVDPDEELREKVSLYFVSWKLMVKLGHNGSPYVPANVKNFPQFFVLCKTR